MISAWLIPYEASRPHDGLLRNPIPTLKKKRIDFYNGLFAGDSRLIGYRNPFARQKNSSITNDLCSLQRRRNTSGNGRKTDALVTTTHLFLPNERRRSAFLLPIRLPNPSFPGGKYNEKSTPPGGRSHECIPPSDLEPKSSYGIFVLMGASRTSHEH
jgi:hypothetical protein